MMTVISEQHRCWNVYAMPKFKGIILLILDQMLADVFI